VILIARNARDRRDHGRSQQLPSQDLQHFLELLPHLPHDLVRDRHFHAALRAFQPLAPPVIVKPWSYRSERICRIISTSCRW